MVIALVLIINGTAWERILPEIPLGVYTGIRENIGIEVWNGFLNFCRLVLSREASL